MRWSAVLLVGLGCATVSPLSPRERALVALHERNWSEATTLLEPLSAASPNDLTLARQLAEAHVKAGTGAALLKRLAGRDDAVAFYQRGLVLFASTASAQNPAIAAFRRAVELEPTENEFHHRLGVALVESEHYEAALAPLEVATRSNAAAAGWWLPLAKARLQLGDKAGALTAIREAVMRHPTPADAKQAKALMLLVSDPFAALPTSARPLVEKALQWLEGADVPQAAIAELETALHDTPDLAAAHALLGLAYARIDDAARAIDELNRAIELDPDDGKASFYLAELYLSRQRPKPAAEHYQRAVDKNPTLEQAWLRLGELASERREDDKARQCFTIATELAPERAELKGRLAAMHQLQGDYAAARNALEEGLSQEPENVDLMLRMGLLFADRFEKTKVGAEKAESKREAAKWLRKVLDAQPENALASRVLAMVQ